MKCPQCTFDNKSGKKFCIECGTKLTLKCPECGSEIEGTEKTWPCELALLALGFTGPEATLSEQLEIETDFRSNYKAPTKTYQTNIPNIFTAGDMRRGQSLIVWAISEGREAARNVDEYLMGYSNLPTKGNGDLPSI